MSAEEIAQEPNSAASGALAPVAVSGIAWWSVERVLYGVAIVVGGWLRLWSLGAQPLSPWEASNSWPAWLAANALQVTDAPSPTSALFYAWQWLFFWAGVNSDGGARFVAAVVGTLMIVLPWWWRGLLGRRVALFTALLIAVDPWLMSFSRLADGAIVGLALGVLALVALWQSAQQPDIQWPRIAAVAVGLLLVAGPMGWNLLPVVVWWGWLLRRDLSATGAWQRQTLVWAVGAGVLGATLLLARIESLAWIATGASVWVTQLDGSSAGPMLPTITGGYDSGWPWLRLWIDSALLLFLGGGGVAVLALRVAQGGKEMVGERRVLLLCVGWLAWGGILWLLPGRSPLALPVVGLPLLLLAAYTLDALMRQVPQQLDWREAGAVILTLTILLVSGVIWLAALLANRNYDPVLAQAALVIFALAIAILVAFGFWANRRDAAWLAAALVAALLVIAFVRSGWKLNFGNVLVEPAGWQATVAHPEVRLLAEDMRTLSSHRAGDPFQLPVQVQVAPQTDADARTLPARPDPVVGWELRNMRNLTWVTAPQVSAESEPLPLVVTPAWGDGEEAPLDLPEMYAGSRYHVDMWWLPAVIAEQNSSGEEELTGLSAWARAAQPWWRWSIYREASVGPQNRDVILWAPANEQAP